MDRQGGITFSLRPDKVALELTLQKLVLENIAILLCYIGVYIIHDFSVQIYHLIQSLAFVW